MAGRPQTSHRSVPWFRSLEGFATWPQMAADGVGDALLHRLHPRGGVLGSAVGSGGIGGGQARTLRREGRMECQECHTLTNMF